MTMVALSRMHFPVTTLGPGRRVGVWLQGCSIRCPGCISVDTWEAKGSTEVTSVVEKLKELARSADGLTVSGGEPFDQPDALAAILASWRATSPTSIVVFTGYELECVEGWLRSHPALIDAVITGPFRSDLPQTLALRGSDNQKLTVLTPLGSVFTAYERTAEAGDMRLDAAFGDDGELWMAGILARGDLARLRRLLGGQGHHIETSDRTSAA